jgi:hypothetical protein
VSSRPTRKQIAEQDACELRRQAQFRLAADMVSGAFAALEEVRAVALFGSVARPLAREVPRHQPFRGFGVETLHVCKDVDVAVWIDRLDHLNRLRRACSQAVQRLLAEADVGLAHHQVDVFLFEPGSDTYLGRLCDFVECPKGKRECLVPGCGREPFLKQHEGFVMEADALARDRCVRLYERGRGVLARAADLPGQEG